MVFPKRQESQHESVTWPIAAAETGATWPDAPPVAGRGPPGHASGPRGPSRPAGARLANGAAGAVLVSRSRGPRSGGRGRSRTRSGRASTAPSTLSCRCRWGQGAERPWLRLSRPVPAAARGVLAGGGQLLSSAGEGPVRQSCADLLNAATRRLRSPARVASTTWLGSTSSSGMVVRSGCRLSARRPAETMATAWPAAMSSSLSSTALTSGPSGAGVPSGRDLSASTRSRRRPAAGAWVRRRCRRGRLNPCRPAGGCGGSAALAARRTGSSRAVRRSGLAAGLSRRLPGDRAGPRAARPRAGAGCAPRRQDAAAAAAAAPG
jgi:hypothetical protein